MANSLNELRSHYEDFLRGERYNHVDRIATAVDDYVQRSRNMGGPSSGKKGSATGDDVVGWGCPRVRYVSFVIGGVIRSNWRDE
eukprot:2673928-Ditylum_brightwellii.AAC.1